MQGAGVEHVLPMWGACGASWQACATAVLAAGIADRREPCTPALLKARVTPCSQSARAYRGWPNPAVSGPSPGAIAVEYAVRSSAGGDPFTRFVDGGSQRRS